MARRFTLALISAADESNGDAEQSARLAYSRAVTHPDVLTASVGIAAEDAEAARREGAAIGYRDVTDRDLPIKAAPATPGVTKQRVPDHFAAAPTSRVHGYV